MQASVKQDLGTQHILTNSCSYTQFNSDLLRHDTAL